MRNKNVNELDKCEGKEKCPLGIDHLPNGNEYALGCGLCREIRMKVVKVEEALENKEEVIMDF